MPRRKAEPNPAVKRRRPPATSLAAKENQMIGLAIDLAEKQLEAGTASSQVITHYLKLATTREQLEQEKIRLEHERLKSENILAQAKADAYQSARTNNELYAKAIEAMTSYSPSQDKSVDDV